MKKWTDCLREDLNMIPIMVGVGYAPKFSCRDVTFERTNPDNPPHEGVTFVKNDVVLWKGIDTTTHNSIWRYAKVFEWKYINHRIFTTLTNYIKETYD